MIAAVRHAAAARWRWNKEGSDKKPKWVAKAWLNCEGCQDYTRRMMGCGWDERYFDKATMEVSGEDSTWNECKICPEWLVVGSVFVNEIYELLPAFKAGTMGNVMTLPMPLVAYLQALDSERERFEGQLYDK